MEHPTPASNGLNKIKYEERECIPALLPDDGAGGTGVVSEGDKKKCKNVLITGVINSLFV